MLCDKKMLCVLKYIFCVLFTVVNAQSQCRTAKGNAGSCIVLDDCPPLQQLSRTKTQDDILYLRQASCGFTQNFKQKICCPPELEWPSFTRIKPVEFPNSVPTLHKLPPLNIPEITKFVFSKYEGSNCPATLQPPKRNSQCCGHESVSTDKIIGGETAAIDQYPWLALLEYTGGDTRCGGALISSRYVLTAAHCLVSFSAGPPQRVRLSEYNTSSYPEDIVEVAGGGIETISVFIIGIEKNTPHPEYKKNLPGQPQGTPHDIGLIKMSRNAPYTEFIRPICLPNADVTKHPTDLRFTVAGWGYSGFKYVDIKSYVDVPYVPLDQCQTSYKQTLIDKQICAGGEKGKDSCTGDSGGPLMYEYADGSGHVIAGIVSFGQTLCGVEGKPAVYTNVYKYLDWILTNMI